MKGLPKVPETEIIRTGLKMILPVSIPVDLDHLLEREQEVAHQML